nr:transposase domain-containing protein [Bradyrhizobium sp. 35]
MRSGLKIGPCLPPSFAACKLNDINPAAYIAETLETIIDGHPDSRIEDLMPWRFRKTSSQPR